jgi:VanZ family protein
MAVQINSRDFRPIFYWLLVFLWMGFIFGISSLPGKNIPPVFAYQDTLYHLGSYAILTYLCSMALAKGSAGMSRGTLLILAFVFGVLYGASDEFHQLFVPGRSCSGQDLLVDGIGSFFGGIVYRWR